jgi:hypothetical protein
MSKVVIASTLKSIKTKSDKACFAGQLFEFWWKKEFSNAQTPLAIIGKSNAFILELEVDENDMVRVSGQKSTVTMDS